MKKALNDILAAFDHYTYGTEVQRYVPVAAILTVLARHEIKGPTPVFLFDGEHGVGKTMQVDAIAEITTDEPARKTQFPSSSAEQQALLAAYANCSTELLCFDSVSKVGGSVLESVLSSDEFYFRQLGSSRTQKISWRAVVCFTGTNPVLSPDMRRRMLVCNITSCGKPVSCDSLSTWHRARGAAEELLTAFALAGNPQCGDVVWGSFESWSKIVPQVIQHAGGPDVMQARHKVST